MRTYRYRSVFVNYKRFNLGVYNEAEIYDPAHDIISEYGKYRQVKVDNTAAPKTLYVVYDKKLYGTKEGMATKFSVVPPDAAGGSSETVRTSFDIASAQGFDVRAPGIILNF